MSPVKELRNSDRTFTILLLECQAVALQGFTFVYLCCPALTLKDKGGRMRETDHTRESRGGGRGGRESVRNRKKQTSVLGVTLGLSSPCVCNTVTIWVTGPSPTVTSISRSIYQFNSFIFLITKLLSLWACAERLWLLIKMELYQQVHKLDPVSKFILTIGHF